MSLELSEETRLALLVLGCAILWTAESLIPLYVYDKRRIRRAWPNVALTALLIFTNLILSFAVGAVASLVAEKRFGLLFILDVSPWLAVILGVAALDLFTYFAHVLLHKSWLGWQFHRVHHSDNEVNVTTAFRQHPGETVWRVLWYGIAIAIFGLPMPIVVIYLTLSTLNAQLEHANVRLFEPLDRFLRVVFVTPNMHKVHHSREQFQTDTNYANILSIWDRLFATYTPTVDFRRLRYGLDGLDGPANQTLRGLLKTPFSASVEVTQ